MEPKGLYNLWPLKFYSLELCFDHQKQEISTVTFLTNKLKTISALISIVWSNQYTKYGL